MNNNTKTYFVYVLIFTFFFQIHYGLMAQRKSSYVKPYVTRSGKIVRGHYRKSYSTSPSVFKNRAKSRYYYHTKGKYIRKRRK